MSNFWIYENAILGMELGLHNSKNILHGSAKQAPIKYLINFILILIYKE